MIQILRSYITRDGLGSILMRALAGSAGIRIIGMAFGFLVGMQLARGLGAAGYGTYGIAMSIISLITVPTEFGLPQLVTREVASAQVRNDNLHICGLLHWANRTVMLISLSMAGAGLIGWLLLKERVDDGVAIALLAGLPLVPLVALGNLRGAALRGMQQIVKGQFPEVILRPALFSLLLWFASILVPSGFSPAIALAMQALAAAATLVVATFMLQEFLPSIRLVTVPRNSAKRWLSSAFPMALTEGMRMLHGNVSILLLGILSTTVTVGVFRVATSMSLLITMPISLLHIVVSPLISRLHASGDQSRLQRMLSCVAAGSFFGVAGVTLPFVMMGSGLLEVVFGREFAGSNASLLVLSTGALLGSLFGAGVILLNMTGHEKRVTRAFALSLLALGVISPPLIQLWGAVGAALANSIAYVLWSALMWMDAYHLLKIDTSIFPLFKRLSGRFCNEITWTRRS